MLNTKKYLKVMADYCSTGLWNEEGFNVEISNHHLSLKSRTLLEAWCNLYETNDDYLPEEEQSGSFDMGSFCKKGFLVASLIKRDLPDYKIVYFNEQLGEVLEIT